MPFEMDRAFYARMYGPTVGDRMRPGDTNLLVEVERDEASPDDATVKGLGETIGHYWRGANRWDCLDYGPVGDAENVRLERFIRSGTGRPWHIAVPAIEVVAH